MLAQNEAVNTGGSLSLEGIAHNVYITTCGRGVMAYRLSRHLGPAVTIG